MGLHCVLLLHYRAVWQTFFPMKISGPQTTERTLNLTETIVLGNSADDINCPIPRSGVWRAKRDYDNHAITYSMSVVNDED